MALFMAFTSLGSFWLGLEVSWFRASQPFSTKTGNMGFLKMQKRFMSYPKSCPHVCILLWELTLNLSFCPRVRGAASADDRMGTEPRAASPEGPACGEAWCGEKCSWEQPSGEAGLWDSIQWRASNLEVHVWEQNLEREASFDHWYFPLFCPICWWTHQNIYFCYSIFFLLLPFLLHF